MPDLPIYPEKRETPEYALERRLGRLQEAPEASYEAAVQRLRLRFASDTLSLTGAPSEAENAKDPLVLAQLRALELIESAASDANAPSVRLIRDVHRLAFPGADGRFRAVDVPPQFKNARPSPPQFIEAKLDNLVDWISGESGRDMFCAARMALWFARFVEIAPFERGNFRTAHLLTSFFSVAPGFPVASLTLADAEPVRAEIERAIQFDTAPLVARFSEALSRTLRQCEEAATGNAE
jgi:Fic family protein